jgi:hypothetical protein
MLQGDHDETHPSLSPDGRWLLYTSTESGESEVYVRSFPDVEQGRWIVSSDGGSEPRWSNSGNEIFYIDGQGQMISGAVATSPSFSVIDRKMLFDPSGWRAVGTGARTYYDVTPDDQRFIMVRKVESDEASQGDRLILIENFFELLRDAGAGGE